MIAENARTALELEASLATEGSWPAIAGFVRRYRDQIAGRVALMTGVPRHHVVVTDDPHRAYGARPADLVTVLDPDDPTRRYRFLARPGADDGALLLLDECPWCTGGPVPVAEIETLADLGRYLAAMGILPPGPDGKPADDPDAPPVPPEYEGDPGHRPDCDAARPGLAFRV